MKGQLSAEMLIVLVIIIAIAALLASTMMKSATNASAATNRQSNLVMATTHACAADSDCTQFNAGADTFHCETNGYCNVTQSP